MKWKPNAHVRMKNGKTGTIKFRDNNSNTERYVVAGDDGKEYYPTDSGITNYTADEKPEKKKGFFRR